MMSIFQDFNTRAFWGSEVCLWKSKGAMAPLFLIGMHVWCTQRHGGFGSHGEIGEVVESSGFFWQIWQCGRCWCNMTLTLCNGGHVCVETAGDVTWEQQRAKDLGHHSGSSGGARSTTDLDGPSNLSLGTTQAWIWKNHETSAIYSYLNAIWYLEFAATSGDSGKLPQIDTKRHCIERYER